MSPAPKQDEPLLELPIVAAAEGPPTADFGPWLRELAERDPTCAQALLRGLGASAHMAPMMLDDITQRSELPSTVDTLIDDWQSAGSRFGVLHLEIPMRGYELQPMPVFVPTEPFEFVLSRPATPVLTVQQLAQHILERGFDAHPFDADPDWDPIWIDDRGGNWIIRAQLVGLEKPASCIVGAMDELPEDYEGDANDYEGPMLKVALRIADLLRDPIACLALANGQPPNFDGLPTCDPIPEGEDR